jgi:thymidine kinase
MFSAKSSTILSTILKHKYVENRVELFKPKFDNRYADNAVKSHSSLTVEASPVSSVEEVKFIVKNKKLDFIMFDEVQFFDEPQFHGNFIGMVQEFLLNNKYVLCAGLDMDYLGNPFLVTSRLLGMADEVKKLTAICNVCGSPAGKTYKISQSGSSIELGGTDKYEARCNNHWKCS